jgi:hypothetical protein
MTVLRASAALRSLPFTAGLTCGLITSAAFVVAAAALPNVRLDAPADGAVLRGVVALAAIADDVGVTSIQFQVAGRNVGRRISKGPCVIYWDTTKVRNGSYVVGATFRDSSGKSYPVTPVSVTVENAVRK